MPLFKHSEPPVETTPAEDPNRKGSLFSRRRGSSPENASTNTSTRTDSIRSGGGGSSFFSRGKNDSVAAAKEKVKLAEDRERAADQALVQARQAVQEAKEHARRLQAEAEEDARLAKLKQKEAQGVTKSTRGLGRHG